MNYPPKLRAAGAPIFPSLLALAALALAGCGGGGGAAGGGGVRLQGAGATFPNPLYQKWLAEYKRANPNVQIDYQSTGSGAGVKQFSEGTIDFGATDMAMTDEERSKVSGEVVHVPTTLGAVVITYNLAGVTQPLKFSGPTVADIYLGKIKKWNDPAIKADNPEVNLPDADITVVYRSDGSGTSAVFTEYLSKVSPEWKERVGAGKSPSWPAGQGGKGNEGVSGMLKQQPNTIGYIEHAYAKQINLPVALIRNRAGQFVAPTPESVAAAAEESVATMPDDLRASVTDAAGAAAYPISSYTYILVNRDQRDAAKGKALVDFLWWALHEGTPHVKQLEYAPLPEPVVRKVEAKLNSITSGGKPLRG